MTLLRYRTRALVKVGYLRGTPWILEYRHFGGNNLEVRTIRREGRRAIVGTLRDCVPITAFLR